MLNGWTAHKKTCLPILSLKVYIMRRKCFCKIRRKKTKGNEDWNVQPPLSPFGCTCNSRVSAVRTKYCVQIITLRFLVLSSHPVYQCVSFWLCVEYLIRFSARRHVINDRCLSSFHCIVLHICFSLLTLAVCVHHVCTLARNSHSSAAAAVANPFSEPPAFMFHCFSSINATL